MKYILSILLLVCALSVNAQQQKTTIDQTVVKQLQEQIEAVVRQNEVLQAELDSVKAVNRSIVLANDTLYKVFKSDIKKAEEYQEEIGFTHWSKYANVVSTIAACIAIVITLFIGYQVYNAIEIKRQIKEISEKLKEQEESNEKLEQTIGSIKKLQDEQEELNYDLLCSNQIFFQSRAKDKSIDHLVRLLYYMWVIKTTIMRGDSKCDMVIKEVNEMLAEVQKANKQYTESDKNNLLVHFIIADEACKSIADEDQRVSTKCEIEKLKRNALKIFNFG